jgi:amidophosphoribosyltransferase
MSGFFGIASGKNCIEDLFYGTDYHSHLGTEYAGLAVLGDKGFVRRIHNISTGQFKSKFDSDLKVFAGGTGIGVISSEDAQPILLHSRLGSFAICIVGRIENSAELVRDLHNKGLSFSEISSGDVNPVEIVAKLISQGENIVDGIQRMFRRIKGSCSLLLLHEDGLYVARDRFGYTPVAIAKKNGSVAVASESCAFPNNGYEVAKFLQPGEVVLLKSGEIKDLAGGGGTEQVCAFLWIYTGFPSSTYQGINVETVRERCGRFLAQNDDVKADLVAGVPDSGVGHAIGYAMESKIPFRRPLVKYTPGYGRSYTPPSQEIRDHVAKMKLIAVKDVIKGNRIVLCEDSIVRGTQLKNFTIQKLKENGAKEVHVRPACPPLMFPCRFNISTRCSSELAARKAIQSIGGRDISDIGPYLDHRSEKYRQMVGWIAKDIGVTTLKYLTVDNMVEAIGLPREKLCLYCWTGECPSETCHK